MAKLFYDGTGRVRELHQGEKLQYSAGLIVLQVLGAVAYAVYAAGQGAIEQWLERKRKRIRRRFARTY